MANEFGIDKLNIDITASSTKAASALDNLIAKVDKLTASLKKLETVSKSVTKSLSSIAKTTKAIDVKPLSSLSSNINNVTKQNTKLQSLSKTMDKLSTSIKKVGDVSKTTTSASGQGSSKGTGILGLFSLVGKIGLIYYGLRRIGQGLASAITLSNEFVETMNLFTVSMGENLAVTTRFINEYSKLSGVDPSTLARNTALFYQISSSMGLATESAQTLSKNFTSLGFDLASFYNITIDEAFTKLKAGLVGETEPLRRLGIILTENNLAETAARLGITKSIRTMTEAEKIQLRYVTALDQTRNAQGDFARTIEQPANQLRILKEQLLQLVRAFGNLFIPVLAATLPYVIALVNVFTQLLNRLSAFIGFEMPEFQGASEVFDDITTSAEEAGNAVQGVLAPFDKLNVLTANSSSSSGGLSDSGMLDLDLMDYDNLLGTLAPKWQEIADKIRTSFENIGEVFGDFSITDLLKSIGDLFIRFDEADIRITPFINALDYLWRNYLGPDIGEIGVSLTNMFESLNGLLDRLNTDDKINNTSNAFERLIDVLSLGGLLSLDTISSVIDEISLSIDRVNEFIDVMDKLITKSDDGDIAFSDFGKSILGAFKVIFGVGILLFKLFNVVLDQELGRMETITKGITQVIEGVTTAIENLGRDFTLIIDGIVEGDFDKIAEGMKLLLVDVSTAFAEISTGIITLLEGLVNYFTGYVSGIVNTFISLMNAFFDVTNPALEAIGKDPLHINEVDFTVDFDGSNTKDQYKPYEYQPSTYTPTYNPSDIYNPNSKSPTTGASDLIGQALSQSMGTSGGYQGPSDIIIQIDSKEIAKANLKGTQELNRQSGSRDNSQYVIQE